MRGGDEDSSPELKKSSSALPYVFLLFPLTFRGCRTLGIFSRARGVGYALTIAARHGVSIFLQGRRFVICQAAPTLSLCTASLSDLFYDR